MSNAGNTIRSSKSAQLQRIVVPGKRLCICGAEFLAKREKHDNYSRRQLCDECLYRKRTANLKRANGAQAAARLLNGTGLTRREAAQKSGVTYQGLCQAAYRLGLTDWVADHRCRAMREFRFQQMRNLHDLGLSRVEAARYAGIPYPTFCFYASQIGLNGWHKTPEAAALDRKRLAAQRLSADISRNFSESEKDFYRLLRKKHYPIAEAAEIVLKARTHCLVPVDP